MAALSMEGIVVRVYASGESDSILKVVTRTQGKVSVFAPRSRKSRKRFGSTIDVLDWGVLQTGRGKGSLPILQSFIPRSSFPRVRESFEKVALATFVCEAFDVMLPEDADDEEAVFEHLQGCLAGLDRAADLKTALKSCYAALCGLLQASGLLLQPEQPSAHALTRLADKIETFVQRKLATKEQLLMVLAALRNQK